MGQQIKKKARSLSLTDDEWAAFLGRVDHHRFRDRNEYLMALVEADNALHMRVALDEENQRVLRPGAPLTEAEKVAAEAQWALAHARAHVSRGKQSSRAPHKGSQEK